ncbi:MAG: hypothetical protein B6U65_02515 [Candidatus Wolframiiraptor sp. EX4484-121]|nr:MAG: hypothetical protein B6U65_02515 [Candidatus Wolframiiraptor sp. EX4484-121]
MDLGDAVVEAAKLMAISARTAPKAKGIDDIEIVLLRDHGDLERLADKMEEIGRETDRGFFVRDAECVRKSSAVLLIGVKGGKPKEIDCGGCGYNGCEEFRKAGKRVERDYSGPNCALQLIDLGIAVGSAAKTASILNVDNRIMFSAGVAAIKLGIIKCSVALGIPLSAHGKNIYFDRKWPR